MSKITHFILLMLSVGACVPFASPTPTPTMRPLSAPTLEASPTVQILSSDEIYSQENTEGQVESSIASFPSGGVLPPLLLSPDAPLGVNGVSKLTRIVLDDTGFVDAELYENALERSAGVVLLGRDRSVWGTLPLELYNGGYTVLVVSLRAQSPLITDLGIILESFAELTSVDPARLAVIGEAEGADYALLGCAEALLCDGVAILSPTVRDSLLNAMPKLQPRPLLAASAQDDALSYPIGLALVGASPSNTTFLEYSLGRGAGLLTLNPDLSVQLLAWLGATLAR